jgi:ribose transport system substrate-binding protein
MATAAAASTDPATVLSGANIQAAIDAYTGDATKLPTTFGVPTPGALKIGWSEARDANELNNRLSYAIGKEVAKMGGTLETLDANGDPSAQVGQIQQLINDKVDAIIVWPLDATALTPAFNEAKKAGIPILAMEVTPDGAGDLGPVDGQVIYGRDIHAFVAATLMSQMFPGGQVATNKFAIPVPSISYYAERAAYWAQQAGMEVVATVDNPSDDVTGGESMSGPVMSKFPDLKGWLAYNDASAMGVNAAGKAAGMTVANFGQNGEDSSIPAIESGQLMLTVQPPVVEWAQQLVAGAYLAKAGVAIPKSVFTSVGNVITKETVAGSLPLKDIIDAAYAG